MNPNYFFIDGSALMAQIRQLQRAEHRFRGRKLCASKFLQYQMRTLGDLHEQSYKRATFYFVNGDEANVDEYLILPDHKIPGAVRDMHFKYCGHKLKKSNEFDKFVEENVPNKFRDRFSKSEKGIDIEMCCDALRLASASRIERLFILTNDGDFIPLCRTIKEFGANISIIHLSNSTPPNSDLLLEADSYDVVSLEWLDQIFLPILDEPQLPLDVNHADIAFELELIADDKPETEKPIAAPSDLGAEVDPSQVEE